MFYRRDRISLEKVVPKRYNIIKEGGTDHGQKDNGLDTSAEAS